MTVARQPRKTRRTFFALILACEIAAIGVSAAILNAANAEPVLTDRQTGLAISGFDPVAYFSDAAPQEGRAAFEYSHDGATWRFRNEGNRAAFVDDPEIYSPRFGGYDPVAIARGASVPGHPLFWLVSGKRLYFFYSAQARAVFAAEPDRIVAEAERKWPAVQLTLP
jgi:YHS domain-containing protein